MRIRADCTETGRLFAIVTAEGSGGNVALLVSSNISAILQRMQATADMAQLLLEEATCDL